MQKFGLIWCNYQDTIYLKILAHYASKLKILIWSNGFEGFKNPTTQCFQGQF